MQNEGNSFDQDSSGDILEVGRKLQTTARTLQNFETSARQTRQDKRHARKEYDYERRELEHDMRKKAGNIIAGASSSGVNVASFDDIFNDHEAQHGQAQSRLKENVENDIRSLSRKLRQTQRNQRYALYDGLWSLF